MRLRRNQWLLANATRHTELTRAASELRRLRPGLAALEPVLFERLSTTFNASVFAEAATAEPRKTPSDAERAEQAKAAFLARLHAPAGENWREKPTSKAEGFGFLGFLAVIIIAGVFKAAVNSPPPPSYPTVPTISFPQPSTFNPPRSDGRFWFTPEQVEEFKKYDPGSGKIPPVLYEFWEQSGRPEAFHPVTIGQPQRGTTGKEP